MSINFFTSEFGCVPSGLDLEEKQKRNIYSNDEFHKYLTAELSPGTAVGRSLVKVKVFCVELF